MTVTKVTQDATLDDLSAQDYRDIYDELRRYDENTGKFIVSLDGLIALIGSAYSKGQWHKYHTEQMALNRTMRNELRSAMPKLFAPLPLTVADAVAQNGLSYVQTVSMQSDIVMLTTRLMHMSGEWIESAMPLPHVGKPQELGSVMTYFRRYQLSAIVGITADDDDDGNEASGNRAQPAQRQPAKQAPTNGHADNPFEDESPATPRIERNVATEKQHKMLFALGKQLYADNWDTKRAELVKAVTGGRSESASDLTVKEMSTLLDGLKKRADDKAAIADVTLTNVPEMAH